MTTRAPAADLPTPAAVATLEDEFALQLAAIGGLSMLPGAKAAVVIIDPAGCRPAKLYANLPPSVVVRELRAVIAAIEAGTLRMPLDGASPWVTDRDAA